MAIIGRIDRRLKRLTTVCCSQCGLIRTDPMPTPEELATYYAESYRLDYQGARADPSRFHVTRSLREAQARLALLTPALHPRARLLDFGSGSGEFIARAQEAGCEVVGIEPGRTYAAFARRRYGVAVIDDERQSSFAAEHFDVITAHHVLEHLRDPVDALKRLAAWLAPNGVVYVSVPNMAAEHKRPHERFHFGHTHGFVPETLDLAALCSGLEPDQRFTRQGTTVVYRKRTRPGTTTIAAPEVAARVIELYPQRSVLPYVASGAWLWPMVRRNTKVLRDTLVKS